MDKIIQLCFFSFNYTGSDDVVFWYGANQFSSGQFIEPYMYGQNYNFMLESLLSVPLISAGVPYNISLPLTTCILGIFPYFIFSLAFYRKEKKEIAFVFVAILLLLPIEHGMLTSMSRGFVSGLFFLSLLAWPVISPNGLKNILLLSIGSSFAFIMILI